MTQEVIGLIACPGSGKTTLANTYDPLQWVICTFDDLRSAMWPPHRRTYWEVRKTERGPAAQRTLHHVQKAVFTGALENGFNVLSADTNIKKEYADEIKSIAGIFDIVPTWKVLEVPLHILKQRNSDRCEISMRVPDDVLDDHFNRLWANDAWWRSEPNVEIIRYKPMDLEKSDSPEELLEKLIKDYPLVAEKAKNDPESRSEFVDKIVEGKKLSHDGLKSITAMVHRRFKA